MATITIDGVPYEVQEGQNLLHAVLSHQLDLPYFCWHPSMGSVGACRQCAVIQYRDEEDERGSLQMACMTSVADGLRISINEKFAQDFRASVIEWLMENHPHDCPVCEEGGECHLQDMTVMTGHSMRRFRGRKRTWRNQDLGPFVGHEMNRCITCYRCVRFYDEYAGGKDLAAFGSRGRMFFGRWQDGTLESEFAGNLVEVCPTGVFTDKPFSKEYTRKWDLQSAPSICPGCGVGCNIFPAERYGRLKRITNRYHGEINRYFLCDRGRFGSHFVNSEKRIRYAGIRGNDGVFEYGDSQGTIAHAADLVKSGAIGIGSPRASLESNFALREFVGKENFCPGINDSEMEVLKTALDIMRRGGFYVPTLDQVENCDAILILGEDISNTAARLALAVRQAVRLVSFELAENSSIPTWQDTGVRGHAQHAKSPLFIATPTSTRLDEIATNLTNGSVEQLANVGMSIAHCINADFEGSDSDEFCVQVANALAASKSPLVITGTGLNSPALVEASANIAWALQTQGKNAGLVVVPKEPNSFGAALLEGGLTLDKALERLRKGEAGIVLENDLYRRASCTAVDTALSSGNIIALDCLENGVSEEADYVFPASTYVEQTGTYVNYETRAQRFYQVFEPEDEIQPSWKWIGLLGQSLGRHQFEWSTFDSIASVCAGATFSELRDVAPNATFRLAGQSRIPRQPHRYSGRTAVTAHLDVHEPKAREDEESPFTFSMEGQNPGDQTGAAIPYSWSPGWNSNQSVFKFQQEVAGELAGGDPGVRILKVDESLPDGVADIYRHVAEIECNGADEFAIVPIDLIFGSDELSSHSPPIEARIPVPFILLNDADASRLQIKEGYGIRVDGREGSFEVRVDPRLQKGLIGLPLGLVDDVHGLPSRIRIEADPDYVRPISGDSEVIARG